MDGDVLTITNDDGTTSNYDILFTFDSDETGKSYIAYTDHKKSDDGNMLVYTSCYNTFDENPRLEEIKTKKELNTVEEILNSIDLDD